MAKGKRYTEDQILAVLKEIDNGVLSTFPI
jgi:hypothetical protein